MKDENKPFNDAIDHFNEIEGNAGNPSNAKINKLPKPLKILWILYDWFHFIIHFVNDFIKFIKLTNTDWWLFLTGALVQEDRGCLMKIIGEDNVKIDMVFDYEMGNNLTSNIQELLSECFQEDFPKNRIYFKQLPHFRFVAFNQKNQLVGHVGIDYRVMNLNGNPIKVLGLIDLCVTQNTRSQGIGSMLLLEIEQFCCNRNIDFLLLFADNESLYLKNGYRSVTNKCKWLKIDHESQITRGIGYEVIEGLMIKEVGKYGWREGDLDFLGYLY